jgi:hypothetical protein
LSGFIDKYPVLGYHGTILCPQAVLLKVVDKCYDINSEEVCDFQELDKVEPAFAILVLGDVGLGPLQPVGKLALREARVFPSLNQKHTKSLILRAEDRFRHACVVK